MELEQSIIHTSSYYVIKKDELRPKEVQTALFYDRDGNFLDEISLFKKEFYNLDVPRLNKKLDPETRGQAKCEKIILGYDEERGFSIRFFDKNMNLILYASSRIYKTKKEAINYFKTKESELTKKVRDRIDLDYALSEEVRFELIHEPELSACSCQFL